MPTQIHLTSGTVIYTDENLPELQGKLTGGDPWAVVDTQGNERAAVRTEQVTHLVETREYGRSSS